MKNMKFNLKTVVVFILILIVLAVTFLFGGNAPGYKYQDQKEASHILTKDAKKESLHKDSENYKDNTEEPHIKEKIIENTEEIPYDENTSLRKEEIPSKSPDMVEPSEEMTDFEKESDENICYISVVCDTIYSNLDFFNKDKLEILPQKGIILPETKAEFYEGESVFSITHRVLKRNKIHFEFTDNPMYSSVYVEGISNIYEFDCGDLSGWMYCVNGIFPNYGCSGYKVNDNDRIEWKYTCNLGEDVGNRFSKQR